jgi:carboxyl-terminal processing protease
MKRISVICFIVLFVFAGFFNTSAQNSNDQSFEILKNLDIFSTMIKELNTNYVDDIKPGELTKTGIDAMLESLDPYTNFIPESEIEDYKFITTGQYGGIGALIHQQGEFVVISEPYEGSPAQKSDLRAGDKVLEINGQIAKGKTYSEVSTILKGQAGTSITIKVLRDGEPQPIEKTINREIIKIDNIPYSGIVGSNIGYIKLTSFTQNAAAEVRQAFIKLREKTELKGIIIDLRGNGGGLLNESVDITNIFVDKGQDVVTTKGKLPDKNHTYKTQNSPVDVNIPLVVLVDNQSASASEILAGSIQDLDRGVIAGQRTFGKGLVQNVIPLSFNSQMKVTVAKYYIPSGRCIQAIDYSHKNKEGSFSKIPDSMISAFKTKGGRIVYEGQGVKPDIKTKPIHYSNIALILYSKYLIFDFVTKFRRENPSIPPPDQFEITDTIYNAFLRYISDKKYDYTTKTEKAVEDLKINAEKEHYFNAIKSEYDALKTQMANDKKGDLSKHKDEIKELLKLDIVTRYHFQKGRVIASLKNDPDVNEGIKIINDPQLYQSVLAGTYKQPVEETNGNDEEMIPDDNTEVN